MEKDTAAASRGANTPSFTGDVAGAAPFFFEKSPMARTESSKPYPWQSGGADVSEPALLPNLPRADRRK